MPPLRRLALPLLILTGALVAFAALVYTRPALPGRPNPEKIWTVAVETAKPAAHAPLLRLYGRVESPRHVRLTSGLSAEVTAVRVREGDTVDLHALLVELDGREFQLRLAQREAELAGIEAQITAERQRHAADLSALEQEQELLRLAQAALDRAQTLEQSGLAAQSLREEARQAVLRQELAVSQRSLAIADHTPRLAEREARRAELEALRGQERLNVERAQVRAPHAGRITKVSVASGDRLRPGDPIAELYDPQTLEIRAQLPARQLPALQQALAKGDSLQAEAKVDGHVLRLRLDRLAARADAETGGVDAFFVVMDGGQRLQLGRFLDLTVALPPIDSTLAMPQTALFGPDRIYKVVNDRLVPVPVERRGETRLPDGGERLLLRASAIAAGDHILITHLPQAAAGLSVRVADQ